MLIPKRKPFRSRKYLDSFNGCGCIGCGICDGTITGAHIRHGWFSMQEKPPDDLTHPLCHQCHIGEQHKIGETKFYKEKLGWTIEQAKEIAQRRFYEWQRFEDWKEGI